MYVRMYSWVRSGFLLNTVYRTLLNRARVCVCARARVRACACVCMYVLCMYVFMITAVYTQLYACYSQPSNKADTQGQCDPTRRDIKDK
jgi:hypothetical protein